MRRIALVGLLCGALAARPAQALEIDVMPGPELSFVTAVGLITAGDADRFRTAVRSQPGKQVVLVISSGGGSVVEAAELANLVSRWRVPVIVADVCVSACFLVFAASPERMARRSSQIGVHSASGTSGENLTSLATTTIMAREAARYGVPQSVLGRMVVTGPEEVAWLNAADLRAMSVVYVDDLLTATPSAPQAPRSPPPSPPVAAIPSSPPTSGQPSFDQGRSDRTAWETWVAQLTGSHRAGAEWWASQRSLPRPGPCTSSDAAFTAGCVEAQRRLSVSDARRRSDPEYRRGWNSY